MAPMTHHRMLEMQARLPPLAGFPPLFQLGSIIRKESKKPFASTASEPSLDAKSTSAGDSPPESVQLNVEPHDSDITDDELDEFYPSDHSDMPPTREPSPEPLWDRAKRYGLREEDIFPQPTTFPKPHGKIPLVLPFPRLPPSSLQRNPTCSGLTQDTPGRFDKPEGCWMAVPAGTMGQGACLKSDADSEIYTDTGNTYTGVTVSQPSFKEMQQEGMKLNRVTSWIRVVHRGYGQVAWRNELAKLNLPIVHGPFASEGDYVMIPAGLDARKVVDALVDINQTVRKIVWFRGMKRANKSRVLFKWEPFSVSPIGDEMPKLLETKEFSCQD
jgi:hypothetical protein